ncbi:MAG TPA: tetratricopeptide repeat protein [Flavipsychrobacter sp.]
MKKIRAIYILVCMLMTQVAFAQTRKLVAEGNKLYEQKQYKQASDNYLKALSKDSTNIPGMFNLGNALLQQKQYDAARKVLSNSARLEQDKNGKAAADYNIGNTYMAEQKWEEAIDAYKKTLRNNPQDADAKYNLSYAQQMLKKNGGGGKDKNKKDKNKDKNKEDKDEKDNKDKQDEQQDKNNKDNKDKKDEQQKPQSQPSKLTEKQAEQLLNALQQEEKKLQDKHKKAKGIPVKVEKDW